ncbi:GatB/YqeY domain-containing protein [Alicyclobacillus kakegawensis]|uniref:GatB/YqeY domain-containing protein n=1 Tax=Alicyclobacillus kakegawensis TaxID=392012 RepID=UPI000830C73C|nr:GatB/YqeY domain-containing protein [Alicyclobacillus kakegawensis]
MSLAERLSDDLKQAMKNRDKLRTSVIRMVRSALKNREIESGKALTDEDVVAVLQKELKQRKDALASFVSAGRSDLAEQAEAEIAILSEYLPQPLDEAQLRELAANVIAEVGAASRADMGKVMSQLMPRIRGRADGKAAQRIVQELLG